MLNVSKWYLSEHKLRFFDVWCEFTGGNRKWFLSWDEHSGRHSWLYTCPFHSSHLIFPFFLLKPVSIDAIKLKDVSKNFFFVDKKKNNLFQFRTKIYNHYNSQLSLLIERSFIIFFIIIIFSHLQVAEGNDS